jgi:hypothetical protein
MLLRLFRRLAIQGVALTLLTSAGAQTRSHTEAPVPVRGTHPAITLQQEGRVTYLVLTSARVALTHKGAYPQGLNAPFAAKLIAEDPGHLLIFTDGFASNPGNIQGQCGGSPTGERYVHVVALGEQARETASHLIESCWLDIVPARAPRWDAAARTLTVDLLSNEKEPTHIVYHIASDGTVKQ